MTNVGTNNYYNYYNFGVNNNQTYNNFGYTENASQNINTAVDYSYQGLFGSYDQLNGMFQNYDPMQQIREWIMLLMQNLKQPQTQRPKKGVLTPWEKSQKQAYADQMQDRWNNGDHSKEVGDAIHKLQSEGMSSTSDGESLHDPYEVNIDGEKYIFVKDADKNGKIDKESEILGFNDTKDNLFADMKKLDTNKDGKVDKSEMEKSGVKLAKVGKDGKVNLAQTQNVNSVDINSFTKNKNFKGEGDAGIFNVNLTNGKNVTGKEVFEDLWKIRELLVA